MTTISPEITDVPWTVAEHDPDVVWRRGIAIQGLDPGLIITYPSSFVVYASEDAARRINCRFGTPDATPSPLSIGEAKAKAALNGMRVVAVVDEEGVEVACYKVGA